MNTNPVTGMSMRSTIDALRDVARNTPDTVALRSVDAELSYASLLSAVEQSAHELRALRLRRVALIADNSFDWIVADLAAQLSGIVLVPIPGFFSRAQMAHAIDSSGAEAVLVDVTARNCSDVLSMSAMGTLGGELQILETPRRSSETELPASTAKISYTSGTTGQPRGVCLPQRAMDAVATSLLAATADLCLRRHLCLLPLATLLENVAGVYAPIHNGGEICVRKIEEVGWAGAAGLNSDRLLRCIAAFRPDNIILVPQMLHAIVEALKAGGRVPDSLQFVAVGGGHVAPTLLEQAESLGLPVFEGYGLTECASVVALCSPGQRRQGSVGKPLAHARIRLDSRGEIFASGASFCGYAGETGSAAAEVATGDIGDVDADGYLFIQGRRKNIFITSFGRNVSPEWIEAEFLHTPSISQIAIFGEARPWNVAVLVPADGSERRLQPDIESVNRTLPDYARISHWILAAEPFTPGNGLSTFNGRVRRNAVWDAYKAQIDSCYDDYLSARV
jgi:long-subunit acyl-CoA synthetase (AMP-forming)